MLFAVLVYYPINTYISSIQGFRLKLCAFFNYLMYKKGKAIPLQAWAGSEGSRRLRLPDFKTIGT
jgi:hypothetical protein